MLELKNKIYEGKNKDELINKALNEWRNEKAKQIILGIAEVVEVGKVYTAKVEKIMPFGAFVSFGWNKEGMIHISKLSSKHVDKVEDVVKIGDIVEVEVIKVDNAGRIDLKLIEKL